jgi:hypothetical protein
MSQGVKDFYFLNNRFNRQLDTYVLNGIVQTCGHRDYEDCECDGMKYAGKTLKFAYEKKGLRLEDHVR